MVYPVHPYLLPNSVGFVAEIVNILRESEITGGRGILWGQGVVVVPTDHHIMVMGARM